MSTSNYTFHPDLQPVPLVGKIYSSLLRSKRGFRLLNRAFKLMEGKKIKGLINEQRTIPSKHGGPDIRVRIYRPENHAEKLPVMLYLHGGGYALGNPEQFDEVLKGFIERRPCVVVAPGYRNSQTEPYPAAFHDSYDTLLWIRDNAEALNVDANKLMISGHSAGGGLTAAVTLKARDTQDVKIAFQMPIYPMIDDRHQNESSHFETPIWGKTANHIGWELYLKGLHDQGAEISSYAAPARNTDYSNFPPTFTFVGSMDPFRDETRLYMEALKQANIPVKYKIFEGCYHGFELLVPKAQVSRDAMHYLYEGYMEFYDEYIPKTKWFESFSLAPVLVHIVAKPRRNYGFACVLRLVDKHMDFALTFPNHFALGISPRPFLLEQIYRRSQKAKWVAIPRE